MKIIDANSSTVLALGRCGENLARKVVFDITDFESLYGVGTVEILHQRPNDAQPYPLAVQRDGTRITWNVTSTDTATSNAFGKCELRYYSGETLVKSKIWQTWVDTALSTPSETVPPEPEQGWVDKVLAAGQAAVEASVNSPKIGSNGNWFVWDFETGAYVDTGVAASGGGSGAVSSVNGKTGEVVLTAGDVGAVPAPATASVGQTIRIKAVDETGRPTEWEAADISAAQTYEVLFEVEEAVESVEWDFVDDEGNPVLLQEVEVVQHFISTNVSGADLQAKILKSNGDTAYVIISNNYALAAGNWVAAVSVAKIYGETLYALSNKKVGNNGSIGYDGEFVNQGALYPVTGWGDRWSQNTDVKIRGIIGLKIHGAVGAKGQFYVYGMKVK